MTADKESTGDSGPMLGPADILGVVQRTASDLHSYCAQPPHMVDRNICMAMIEHVASMLGYFPPLQPPAEAVSEQRAN